MKKFLSIRLIWFLVLSGFLFNTCKKEGKFDLFPLKTGNEFYYKYNKESHPGPTVYTIGTETWKVVNESEEGNHIKYTIERRLNAKISLGGYTYVTKVISDSIQYLEILEDKKTALISFLNITFKRYQSVSQIEINQGGQYDIEGWSYLFKTDSGMTKYNYYHRPNQITIESLHLDSITTIQ